MLIKVNDPTRMPIQVLWRLIFIFTFDKERTADCTKGIIEQQLMKWDDFIKTNKRIRQDKFKLDPQTEYAPVGKKGDILDELEYQLGNMCSWVVREENGEFTPKVDNYKKHGIDYRLCQPMSFAFPECHQLRDIKRGEEALKANMEEYPEIYQPKNRIKGV